MIQKKLNKQGPIEIDLTGPDGNVFVLLGYAKNFARQLELDFEPIQKDMLWGDYEHLLGVFEHYFGDYVILYR
jgi:hypothetical protein